jgi:type VI protein secretion system component Hcp
MTDQKASDLLMRFIKRNGDGVVWAESMLDILDDDEFQKEFTPASSLDDYSNFFEISSFSFGLDARPQETQKREVPRAGASNAVTPAGGNQWNTFYRWATQRKGKPAKPPEFPDILVEFGKFSFSRIIDGASPDLFQACCDQTTFAKAVLVKRVSTGLQGGDRRQAMGYLKFEFFDVLLVSFGWEDGDLITENCAFVCKKMLVKYRQQDVDGQVNKVTGELYWDQRSNDRINKGTIVNRNQHG